MTKKHSKPQTHILSPLGYIKTKVRLLPLYKCYINSDWLETGLVTIIVARKHPNGNFTFGVYVLESYKRGLVITIVLFSQTEKDLEFHIEKMVHKDSEEHMILEIEYDLAHNIIFQSIALAKKKGYIPHREFSVSKYILEEDDDKIKKFDIDYENNEMRLGYEAEEERLRNEGLSKEIS